MVLCPSQKMLRSRLFFLPALTRYRQACFFLNRLS